MKSFYPQTGTTDEWNAAYYRLEDYFRAYRITNKIHESQIILRLLQRAANQHALDPGQSPTRLALEEAYAVIDRWFQQLLPDQPAPLAAVVGRVSLHLMGAMEKWPGVFLAEEEEIPGEFKAALRDISIQSGPDLRVSSMVPRPLDAEPAAESMDETWERLGKSSLLVLVGMASGFALAFFFYLSR